MNNEKYKAIEEKINSKAWASPVPFNIIKNCYKFFYNNESQWKNHFDEAYYIIGLSEDRYDYYWLAINNKSKELKFITCVYNIDKPCDWVDKKWNKNECKEIVNIVKEYFKNHSVKENLIYLDEKLIYF